MRTYRNHLRQELFTSQHHAFFELLFCNTAVQAMVSITRRWLAIVLMAMLWVLAASEWGYAQGRMEAAKPRQSGNRVLTPDVGARVLEEPFMETGFQSIAKERATGSYAFVDSSLWGQRVGSNMLKRLEGLTTALLQNTWSGVQIRGLSSLHGESMMPLLVLDNFPYEGDVELLQPSDIESVTLLRDAAAASIWGVRGGNGVIVLTRRSPSRGPALTTSVTSMLRFSPRPNLFSANHMASSEYVAMERMLYEQGYYKARFSMVEAPPIPLVAELLESHRLGILSAEGLEEHLEQLQGQDYRTDMQKYLYRSGWSQHYGGSMSGSREGMQFMLSAAYDQNLTHLAGNEDQRLSLRSTTHVDITDRLTMQVGLWMAFQQCLYNSPGAYGGFRGLSGYSMLATADGEALPLDIYYRRVFTDTAGGGRLLDWKYRPLEELHLSDNDMGSKDIILDWGIDYRWKYGLSAGVKLQKHFGSRRTQQLHHPGSYHSRNLINRFTLISPSAIVYQIPLGAMLEAADQHHNGYSLRGQIDYHSRFGRHELHALGGSEISNLNREMDMSTLYGYDPDKAIFKPIDPTHSYASFHNLFGMIDIPYSNDVDRYQHRVISLYGNVAYTYADKYTFTGSLRRDAVNLLGLSDHQKWNPQWSVGGLWHLAQEAFMASWAPPKLSLRASYGYSGSIPALARSAPQIAYYSGSRSPIYERYAAASAAANATLGRESVRISNIGVDFALATPAGVTGTVEYYKKVSDNLFLSTTLDPIAGISKQLLNSASLEGQGLDVQVVVPLRRGALQGSSMLMFSYADYIVRANRNPPSLDGYVSSGHSIFPAQGFHPYLVASYRWAGLNPDNGNPRGYLKGQVSEDYDAMQHNAIGDQLLHGPAVPRYFGSWRNTVQWKQWTLMAALQVRLGYYFRKQALHYGMLFQDGQSYGNEEYARRWRMPGDEAHSNVPSQLYPADAKRDNFYVHAAIHVQKADNLRFKELRLDYQLPEQGLPMLRSLSCYAHLDNIHFILWKANTFGLDPDNVLAFRSPIHCSIGVQLNL